MDDSDAKSDRQEPSLDDNPFELSDSDEDDKSMENSINSGEITPKLEPEATIKERLSPADDFQLPTQDQSIKEEPKDDKSDSEKGDSGKPKKKEGKSKKELEEEDREKMQ